MRTNTSHMISELTSLNVTLEKESLNRVQKQGMTALMLAARRGKSPLVECSTERRSRTARAGKP